MRHKLIGLIVSFTVMVSLMAIPAKAGEGEWAFAVGVKGISGDLDTSGSESDPNITTPLAPVAGNEVAKATKSANVEVGAIFAEFIGRDGWGGITFGVEMIPGSSTLGTSTRTDTDLYAADTSASVVRTAKAEVEDVMTAYLEPTLYVSEAIGVYVKGGVTTMTLNTLETISGGTDSSTYPNKNMVGAVHGYGVKYSHPSGFLVKLEYTDTNFKPYDETSSTGNKNRIKADIDFSATSLAIGWQF